MPLRLTAWCGSRELYFEELRVLRLEYMDFYFEELRVLAGIRLAYISTE